MKSQIKGFRVMGDRRKKLIAIYIKQLSKLAKLGVNPRNVLKHIGTHQSNIKKMTTKQLSGAISEIKQFIHAN